MCFYRVYAYCKYRRTSNTVPSLRDIRKIKCSGILLEVLWYTLTNTYLSAKLHGFCILQRCFFAGRVVVRFALLAQSITASPQRNCTFVDKKTCADANKRLTAENAALQFLSLPYSKICYRCYKTAFVDE